MILLNHLTVLTTEGWNIPKNNVNIWLSHKVHQFRALRTILRFLPTILFRNLNFLFLFLFDRQCYWLGGGRMVDPVWERYARRRKGLINGGFFRINACYIKILKRDSSIWHFASYHIIYLVLDSMNSQEIEECLLFYSTLIQFHGKQVWNWLCAIALVFIHLWICNFPKTL